MQIKSADFRKNLHFLFAFYAKSDNKYSIKFTDNLR